MVIIDTANSIKFDNNNNERCNMSDQRISREMQFQIKSAHRWSYRITNRVFSMIYFYICL